MTDIRIDLADAIAALERAERAAMNADTPLYATLGATLRALRARLDAENAARSALRDQFAVAAFQAAMTGASTALVARTLVGGMPGNVMTDALTKQIMASAYLAADEMLAERDKERT